MIKEKPIFIPPAEGKYLRAICREGVLELQDLADKFILSPATVKTQVYSLLKKLQVKSKAELIYKFYNKKLPYYVILNSRTMETENGGWYRG